MIIKRFLTLTASFLLLLAPSFVGAQSKSFKIGKSLDVQMNVLNEIALLYVDSVEVDSLLLRSTEYILSSLDPYSELISDENRENLEMLTMGSYGGLGAIIRKKGDNVLLAEIYENSPAAKAGLVDGDEILEIDGALVAPLAIDECSAKMRGMSGTEVALLIKRFRGGDTTAIKVMREKIHLPDVIYYGVLSDTIGYIRISGFTVGGAADVKKALLNLKRDENLKRVILDFRGNGGGILDEAVNIVSLFVPRNTLVVSARGKYNRADIDYYTTTEPVDIQIPLIVMVNSASASSSEIVAGALQDLDRATIVGTRTFGKGLVQSIRDVGYNNKIKITTAKYYIPSGRCVQAIDYSRRNEDGSVGNIPDSLVTPFKTLVKGRTVYDGGGITPDYTIESQLYSRPALSLIYENIFHQYSLLYSQERESIASPSRFSLTDAEYDNFVEWAKEMEFDHRSSSQIEMERLIELTKMEQLLPQVEKEIEALLSKLEKSKEQVLREGKDQFKFLLEEEIVNRYYYQRGKIESMLRNDNQFEEAKSVVLIN